MNPFEIARNEAVKLRTRLKADGMRLEQSGLDLVTATCKRLDVALREVKTSFPLLKGADATIIVERKWILVRSDVSDEIKAYLVAHELGHLQLHPATTGTIEVSEDALTGDVESNGVREVESYGARERQELQANVFAREFLLPRDLAHLKFIYEKHGASRLAEGFKLPLELVRLQLYDAILLPSVDTPNKVFQLPEKPTKAQEPAVNSDAETSLVEAGPGTGKTTTLLLRLRRLITAGIAPEKIVILTFSNKAARELVERAHAGNIPGADRVWIGTFHAFGLEFLRKFGNLCGLDARFPVLDKLASLAMLEAGIASADLEVFDPLSNPSPWLENALDTIRRAKDEVFDAAEYRASVEENSSGDQDTDAKRRDVATIFERYELLLSRRKAIDLTDLLCVSIKILQSKNPGVERFLGGIQHLMVDEYQDVNRASALLVKELAKFTQSLWVVGDANQAIYAFMGASSTNLERFQVDFPGAVSIPLQLNHRSSQEIVNLFDEVASRNPAGRSAISMIAERGYLGHAPCHLQSTSEEEQVQALAWRIRQLEQAGIPLAEQAVIVYKNAHAAVLALGLEKSDVPVLYLGNIFERPEIKDLICLLQLAVDPYGVNLVRQWYSPLLALSRQGADTIFSQTHTQERDWLHVTGEGLSTQDTPILDNLRRLCTQVTENMSPWEALSALLLEDGAWLREMADRSGQAAANALMAVWQFVHFCRSPDGTGRWSTVGNLPQRIRDRTRLGEDRSMRVVPPEAEGMNAVRIFTAHGSKGLEFDAVHFLHVTKNTYESPRAQPNKLLPDTVLEISKALDIINNERHNLLYVAVSRPRLYLTIYSTIGEELPSALHGLLEPIEINCQRQRPSVTSASRFHKPEQALVSMEEYLQFVKCPQRYEMSIRARRSQREDLKVYRAIDLATSKAIEALVEDALLLKDENWRSVIEPVLVNLGLHEHSVVSLIRDRVEERVIRGRNLLAEGKLNLTKIGLAIGPLSVELHPDQVFQDGALQRLRIIRPNKSSLSYMKQPLAALLDAHHQSGGVETKIEIATLSDGLVSSVGTIKAPTRQKYEKIAISLCAKHFPMTPSEARNCHFCPYSFPCSKRPPD